MLTVVAGLESWTLEYREGRGETLVELVPSCRPKAAIRHVLRGYIIGHTSAIAKYSTTTEATFSPNVTQTAIVVDIPSISDITSGPNSLQNKSIRRI